MITAILAILAANPAQGTGPASSPSGPPQRALNHMGPPDWTDKVLKSQIEQIEQDRRSAELDIQQVVDDIEIVQTNRNRESREARLRHAISTLRQVESALESRLTQIRTELLRKSGQIAPWDASFVSRAFTSLESTYYDAKYFRLRLEEQARLNSSQPAK